MSKRVSCFSCFSARKHLSNELAPNISAQSEWSKELSPDCAPNELAPNIPAQSEWSKELSTDCAVGIEQPIQEVIKLLDWESPRNAAVLLHGLGGTGKTTLAHAVIERVQKSVSSKECKYSKVTLFSDITSNPDIIGLQLCILKDLMETDAVPDIRTCIDGQREIGRILEKEVAFIFIDNVLSVDPLERLLPRGMQRAKKLRLLMTGRDVGVRRGCSLTTVHCYLMQLFTEAQAVTLLKKEIYGGEIDGQEGQINSRLNKIVDMCGGIPLLLSMAGKSIRYAKNEEKGILQVLQEREHFDGEVFSKVEPDLFHYDSLPYRVQDPFLDICSFFNGWDWDTVACIVGEYELELLEWRALVSKNTDMTLKVHPVILTFGLQKTDEMRFKFSDASASKIQDFLKEDITEIRGLWYNNNVGASHISATILDSTYSSLRILALGNMIKVDGKCSKIFQQLIFFRGEVPSLPFNVSKSKELTYLEYQPQHLNLSEMPTSLRHIELDGKLHSTDAFTIDSRDVEQLKNLRTLRLINFAGLKKLPEAFGDLLNGLQELTLSYCRSIEKLPDSISKLQCLKVLNMDHCSSLKLLPEDFGSLSSLQKLDLSYCESIEELPESISGIQSLRALKIGHCSNLKRWPGFESFSSSLKEFDDAEADC